MTALRTFTQQFSYVSDNVFLVLYKVSSAIKPSGNVWIEISPAISFWNKSTDQIKFTVTKTPNCTVLTTFLLKLAYL